MTRNIERLLNSRAQPMPPFAKMAGGGNDFVVIDNRAGIITDPAALAWKVCVRRLSVGADGLILIESSNRATFRMRYFNRDGSEAFCANGTRCAARFAFLSVIAPRRMNIETDAGMVGAEVNEQGSVTLALPDPIGFRSRLPLSVGEREIRGSFISVGVPHYVLFLEREIWSHDIEPLGKAIRRHPDLLPRGANVDFVFVRGRNDIHVRTYERGVEAETLSCGSGVVASAAVSALFGRIDSPVSVRTRSGITLVVAFRAMESETGRMVSDFRLTGDARLIYRAELTPETLEGFDPDWLENPVESTPA